MSHDLLCSKCITDRENRIAGSKVYKRKNNGMLPDIFDPDRDYEEIRIENSRYIACTCQACSTEYNYGYFYKHYPIVSL